MVVLLFFVCLWFRDDLPKFLDHTCPCTLLLFIAYAIVRTEPSATSAKPEEIKNVFGCLLRCLRWRNANLAGGFAGRLFGVVVFRLFYRFAYAKDFFVRVQCFDCLLTC